MTDDELKQLFASIAIEQKETSAQIKELVACNKATDAQLKVTDTHLKATDAQLKATDLQIKELGKQIGGLGEKFGSFTEGMAFPAMRKVLRDQFGMEAITTRYEVKRNGNLLELDVFAYSNGQDQKAIIVEVKSHLREKHITRLLKVLTDEAKHYLPEHANKKFYGILATVDAQESLKAQVINNGLYYAEIHDDVFALKVPSDFQARTF